MHLLIAAAPPPPPPPPKKALLYRYNKWRLTYVFRGQNIGPPFLSPPRGICQLKCPLARKCAFQDKECRCPLVSLGVGGCELTGTVLAHEENSPNNTTEMLQSITTDKLFWTGRIDYDFGLKCKLKAAFFTVDCKMQWICVLQCLQVVMLGLHQFSNTFLSVNSGLPLPLTLKHVHRSGLKYLLTF